MANILMLPDEIKLKIFQYLTGVDIIELSKVCNDFSRLVVDREVLKNLNFTNCYKTNVSHLRYVSQKKFASRVETVNLNGVYWITTAQLRLNLMKLINLKALYVCDTQLSICDLATILGKASKVKKLAFSLKHDNSGDAYRVKVNIPLSHLFVTYSPSSLRALSKFLSNFDKLEELWIVEPYAPPKPFFFNDLAWLAFLEADLPVVFHKLVMVGRCEYFPRKDLTSFTNKFLQKSDHWIKFRQDYNGLCYLIVEKVGYLYRSPELDSNKIFEKHFECLHQYYPNILDIEDVEKMILKKISHSNMRFSAMNFLKDGNESEDITKEDMDACMEAFEGILLTRNMSKVKKIKSFSYPFWTKIPDEVDNTVCLFKKRRTGLRYQTVDDGLFARFTEYCKEIEDCEIVHNNKDPLMKMHWQTDALKFIRNWKVLKRLHIKATDFRNGKFFIEITKGCALLTSLKVTDNSFQDKISKDLCESLKFAKNLKDFRYERDGGIPFDEILQALTLCPKLERVYLQCRYATKISKKPLETLMTRCENLVFLFIYIMELPETICKSIKQTIDDFSVKPQQVFRIRGQSYYIRTISYEEVPFCHISDLVCDVSDLFRDYYGHF